MGRIVATVLEANRIRGYKQNFFQTDILPRHFGFRGKIVNRPIRLKLA